MMAWVYSPRNRICFVSQVSLSFSQTFPQQPPMTSATAPPSTTTAPSSSSAKLQVSGCERIKRKCFFVKRRREDFCNPLLGDDGAGRGGLMMCFLLQIDVGHQRRCRKKRIQPTTALASKMHEVYSSLDLPGRKRRRRSERRWCRLDAAAVAALQPISNEDSTYADKSV